MDKEKVKNLKGVVGSKNVKIYTQYINENYQTKILDYPKHRRTTTGLVKFLKIYPKQEEQKNPTFICRWDGSEKTIDIDMNNEKERGRKDFNGHHTEKIKDNKFLIDITTPENNVSIPNKKIFKGKIILELPVKYNYSERGCSIEGKKDKK